MNTKNPIETKQVITTLLNQAFKAHVDQLGNPQEDGTYLYKHSLTPKYRKSKTPMTTVVNGQSYPVLDKALYLVPPQDIDATTFSQTARSIIQDTVLSAAEKKKKSAPFHFAVQSDQPVIIINETRTKLSYPKFATNFAISPPPEGSIMVYGKTLYQYLNHLIKNPIDESIMKTSRSSATPNDDCAPTSPIPDNTQSIPPRIALKKRSPQQTPENSDEIAKRSRDFFASREEQLSNRSQTEKRQAMMSDNPQLLKFSVPIVRWSDSDEEAAKMSSNNTNP